jgi:hypothetical protein
MIGFITTTEIASLVLSGIEQAMTARGLTNYWSVGSYPIYSGVYAGSVFIPADEDILTTPLHGNPVMRPTDFPEFEELVSLLGGLETRVEIDPQSIVPFNIL